MGCREDPVGVQDAPSADVLLVVLDADLPRPRIHRGLLPAHHPWGLQALPTGWSQEEGGRNQESGARGDGLPLEPKVHPLRAGAWRGGEDQASFELFIGRP